MSREWFHWVNGTKTAWASGLPDADCVLTADFLNQFVEWGKYLYACGGESRPAGFIGRRTLEIVKGVTEIQDAVFWRSLQFFPSPLWLACGNDGIGGDLTDWAAVLSDFPAYQSIASGDDIHPRYADTCRLRNYLSNIRQRMDACQTWNPTATVAASGFYHKWAKRISTGEIDYTAPTSVSPSLQWNSQGRANNPSMLDCHNYYVADMTVTMPVPAGCAVYALDNPYGDDRLSNPPFANPGAGNGAAIIAHKAEDCSAGWLAISGDYGKASTPFFFDTHDEYGYCGSTIQIIGQVLDAVPDAYKF